MRYCRFITPSGPRFGKVEQQGGKDSITAILPDFPEVTSSPDASAIPQRFFPLALDAVQLLAPVKPGKILCVGRNYRDHANELGSEVPVEPLVFLKPPSAVIAPGEAIEIPPASLTKRVDYEGEIAVVIGKRCRNLRDDEDVRRYIRGYTCANDVTARDLQKKDGQWARAKGFDTFCPVGPTVSDELDIFAKPIEVTTRLNGEQKQRGNSGEFIFPLDRVMRHITAFLTLEPGDLILTGTPAGVSPMKPGDMVEVSIPGIGVLKNPVR